MRSRQAVAAGGALAIAALVLAGVAGAGVLALLIGIVCGIGLAFVVWGLSRVEPSVERVPAAIDRAAGLDALLGAVGDPLLLVEDGRVVRANAPALETLGPHIVNEDVRLAIRHPAAADLLARDDLEDGHSVDLAGLGTRDRYWTLSVRGLPGGRRLVRLADRTENRAAERMRVDFVANASHELRTPLASLIGFIETLEDANGPDDVAVRSRFLGIMAGEARRMQRLIDDLISLSRIEADRHRAPDEAVALAALVREVADAIPSRERVEIVSTGDAPAVAGDRVQLSQLIHNLVGNALKYGDADKPVRVAIAAAPGNMVRLEVADRGNGIAPQHLPRLTERFYRVDPSRSRAVGGTGLGLAIVKHIVERHRGRLDIASEVGVGTRVTVLLPARAGADPRALTDAPVRATG